MSASGNYDCAEGRVCEIDVPNGERFVETFTPVARHGYGFAGWRGSESYLCAGNTPLCVVDIPSTATVYDADGYMTAGFYHEPELVYHGTLDTESSVWSADITYDALSLEYVADFDADGDDDNDFFVADHGYDADPFPGWSNQLLL